MAGRRWEIIWSPPGRHALEQLPWRAAERVDAAVQRLAEHNEGELQRIEGDPVGALLRVGTYLVRLTLDRDGRALTVWWIYRT